jgi:hypothetical protein
MVGGSVLRVSASGQHGRLGPHRLESIDGGHRGTPRALWSTSLRADHHQHDGAGDGPLHVQANAFPDVGRGMVAVLREPRDPLRGSDRRAVVPVRDGPVPAAHLCATRLRLGGGTLGLSQAVGARRGRRLSENGSSETVPLMSVNGMGGGSRMAIAVIDTVKLDNGIVPCTS